MPTRNRKLGVCLCAVLLALLACKKGAGGECKGFNRDCEDNLVCHNPTMKCMELEKARALCAADERCKTSGACGISSVAGDDVGVCVPTSDEHCKSSDLCTKEGRCKFAPAVNNCE